MQHVLQKAHLIYIDIMYTADDELESIAHPQLFDHLLNMEFKL